jgi:hypothetical protein
LYFTTNLEQAKKWSVRGNGVTHGYVYKTCIDYSLINNGKIRLKEFLEYNDEFIDTFTYCRTYGKNPGSIKGYDIIYGLIVDSNGSTIYKICDEYAKGKIGKIDVKRELKTLNMSDQICIKNKKLINSLRIIDIKETQVIKGRNKIDERNITWIK